MALLLPAWAGFSVRTHGTPQPATLFVRFLIDNHSPFEPRSIVSTFIATPPFPKQKGFAALFCFEFAICEKNTGELVIDSIRLHELMAQARGKREVLSGMMVAPCWPPTAAAAPHLLLRRGPAGPAHCAAAEMASGVAGAASSSSSYSSSATLKKV